MNCSTIDDKNQEQQREEERYDASIFAAFEKVHDGRKAQGKRYPLSLLLILLSLGKMAGEQTITGVVDWVKEREPWLKKQLNWPKRFPVVATFTHALAHCDAQEGEHAMMCVLQKAREKQQNMAEREKKADQRQDVYPLKHLAIDGKTLCGTQNHQAENQPSVHLLSLYDCETGIVLGHVAVEKKTNEITGAKIFLEHPLFSGCVVTSDAMHTQKKWFAAIHAQQGYCLSVLKRNHKKHYTIVKEFFENTENNQGKWQYFRTQEKGHGREEVREIWVTTHMRKRLARSWKKLTYVYKIQRTVKQKGKESTKISYGITNIPQGKADAERILELKRNHWSVEVLAGIHNGILAIMDYLGIKNVASQLRHFCAQPEEALRFLLDELPLHNGKTK
jgi:predicted transposase YbfD/YdcC